MTEQQKADKLYEARINAARNNGNRATFARPISMLSHEEIASDQEGLTKREQFAALAMQSLLQPAATASWQHGLNTQCPAPFDMEIVATQAVTAADELLKALEVAPRVPSNG